MKISRWKMIWGLKLQLFEVFTMYLAIAAGILFGYIEKHNKNAIIFSYFAVAFFFFLYAINSFGYIIDIILKNIGETGWIPIKNVKELNPIPGFPNGYYCGREIKVFEEGKKPKRMNVFKKLAPWPEGKITHYKFYYLKICRAVVGFEVIREEKTKINLSRKPRKSK